jgi:hypothetical protein
MAPQVSMNGSACVFARVLVHIDGALTDICTPDDTGNGCVSSEGEDTVTEFLETSGADSQTWSVYSSEQVTCALHVERDSAGTVKVELVVNFMLEPACTHHSGALQDCPCPPQPTSPLVSQDGHELRWSWTISSDVSAYRFVPEISACMGEPISVASVTHFARPENPATAPAEAA